MNPKNITPRTALASGRGKSGEQIKANYESYFTTIFNRDQFQEEKVCRQALVEIQKNLDQWFCGDKFYNPALGRNDGEFFASEVEIIVVTAMRDGAGRNFKSREDI